MNLREARRQFEIAYFEELLAKYEWKILRVAKEAGISKNTCYVRLCRLGFIKRYSRETPLTKGLQ